MSRPRFVAYGLIAAFFAALAACSTAAGTSEPLSGNTGDAGASGEAATEAGVAPSAEGFCNKTYGIFTNHLGQCCSSADRGTAEYSATEKAYQRVTDDCVTALKTSLASERARLDPDATQRCIDAYAPYFAKVACWDGLFDLKIGNVCDNVFVGLQPEGAACSRDYECLDGLWCSQAQGKCVASAAVGGACASPSTGKPSVNHPRCVDGSACATDTKTCVPLKKAAASCTLAAECASGHCYMGKCGTVGPAALGQPCASKSDCGPGVHCEKADGGAVGTCAKGLLEGSPCDPSLEQCRGLCKAGDGGAATCVSWCGTG